MLYITRGRYHSQFYHSQAHPLPPTAMPAKPEPMCSLLHTATARETLYQIAIYHQKPLAALLLRPTLNPCAPHKDQQQYRDSGDATADHRGPPRVHQTISTAEDHLDAEIGSLTESTETSRQTTQHAVAQLLPEAHSGQIQWISAYESRAPESGQMSMPMGGTIEHRSTPNAAKHRSAMRTLNRVRSRSHRCHSLTMHNDHSTEARHTIDEQPHR